MDIELKRLKYFILILIDDFKKRNIRAYEISMRTILRGSSTEVANSFIESKAHGKFPKLTNKEYKLALRELIKENKIAKFKNENKKRNYYKKLSSSSVDTRFLFDILFDLNPGVESNLEIDIEKYEPVRDPRKSTAASNKGVINIDTLLCDDVEVAYESNLEKEFIFELANSDYIKRIIEQSVTIPYGKNKKYTPDFVIKTHHDYIIMIEVKNISEISNCTVLKKFKALDDHFSKEGILTNIVSKYNDEWISLSQVRERERNLELEAAILEIISNEGSFDNSDYLNLIDKVSFNELDFHNVIISNQLIKKGSFNNYILEMDK